MIGYFLRTSAAASRPSSTSCAGVYLFFGSLTTVCATRPLTDTDTAVTRTAAQADGIESAIRILLCYVQQGYENCSAMIMEREQDEQILDQFSRQAAHSTWRPPEKMTSALSALSACSPVASPSRRSVKTEASPPAAR